MGLHTAGNTDKHCQVAFIPWPRRCHSALPYFSFLLLAVRSSLPFLFARPCPTEMRFLPSNPARVAAEVLLTVAIVAFVAYDLSGRSSVKPEASNVELSFEAKRPRGPPPRLWPPPPGSRPR